MKKCIVILAAVFIVYGKANAQEAKPAKQFMQVTTVESVVAGGLGRSRLLITNPDGSQKELDLENLFSLTGINFKNIKQNEDRILQVLKEYTGLGWNLEQVIPLTLSPNDTGSGGIFMTRYLFSKI
ncbi:MAG TPA: hypothetical protein PKC39_00120 [Ferruginibacter sp.]|nr:hypothetical protein [Ferruginibacter sp.]HMP19334.1 hypothetical protein [Ferruginibacter sp.]